MICFTFFLAVAPGVNQSREVCGEEATMVLYYMSQAERKSQPKILQRLSLLNSCCLEMVDLSKFGFFSSKDVFPWKIRCSHRPYLVLVLQR